MKRFLLATASVAALLALAPVDYAEANSVRLCRGAAAGAMPGPGRWSAGNSGNVYTLNSRGCVIVQTRDLQEALSAGFVIEPPFGVAIASTQTAAFTMNLPASTYIQKIIVEEVSGTTVTGGIKIGTTSGGRDIVDQISAQALSIATTVEGIAATDASRGWKLLWPTGATSRTPWTLYLDAVSSFSTGAVTVTVVYGYY